MKKNSQEQPVSYHLLDHKELWWVLLVFLLLLVSLFLNLGLAPLKHEEPRRALISLEMLFRNNWIVPTEFGEYYYKKPPLFNWVIIAGFYLFGNYSEFAVRFFPILSFIGMGILVFWVGRKYVSLAFGIYAGLLTLTMVDILYYFSATAGEIDLFYSFITLASFFTIFHFYEKQQYYLLFITTYSLGAIGTLTKGLPSLVFLALSIGVFFLYKRELKKLFGLAHISGILLFVVIVGGYFWWYSQYNALEGFYASDESLWSQASERTMLRNQILELIPHLFTFPLITLQNIAPASLLVIFLFRKNLIASFAQNRLIIFCFFILMTNLLVYWISPGTRSRYVYMLYPLAVMLLTYGYLTYLAIGIRMRKVFGQIVMVLIILSLVASVLMPFIPPLANLEPIIRITILTVISLAALLFFHFKRPQYALLQVIALAVIIRLVFATTVLPIRATEGSEATDKKDAKNIVNIVEDAPLYMYAHQNISRTTVFYIEQARKKVLSFSSKPKTGIFFLAQKEALENQKYQIFYTFAYDNQEFVLIQFK